MKAFTLIAAVLVLLVGPAWLAYARGQFDILHRGRGWNVQVNNKPIRADVLVGRASLLVTRRDKNNEHSYLLLYAGDIDRIGDGGQVLDCGAWVAPKLPILIQTNSYYPNCNLGAVRRIALYQVGA